MDKEKQQEGGCIQFRKVLKVYRRRVTPENIVKIASENLNWHFLHFTFFIENEILMQSQRHHQS